MSDRICPVSAREAFERAVEAISHKERTSAEIRALLGERGFSAADVESAFERLIETGAVDDERFARLFAEDKRELRGWGPERIREGLAERGIDRGLAERVAAAEDRETQLARAAELLAARAEPLEDERSRGRALAFLARRGYESELAYDAIRRAEGDRSAG